MDRPISSEEKLLNFIRKKNQPSSAKKIAANPKGQSVFSDQAGEYRKGDVNFLKLLSRVLIFLAVVFIGYIFYKGFMVNQNEEMELSAGTLPETEIPAAIPPSYEMKPLNYYVDLIDQRDIFNTSFEKQKIKKPELVVLSAVDPTKNLRLVGVVLAKEPQAVVEDLDAKETAFLAKGDTIREMVVEDIQESKIILGYRNQRFELTNEVRRPGQ